MNNPAVATRSVVVERQMPHWNGVTDCEVLVVEPNKSSPTAGTLPARKPRAE
jgi:hypothetical protein